MEFFKRKESIASGYLIRGNGSISVNKDYYSVFNNFNLKLVYDHFKNNLIKAKKDVVLQVKQGGAKAQLKAVTKVFCKLLFSENLVDKKEIYQLDHNLLSSDPRRTYPKKYGGRGSSVRRQKSYR